MQTTTDSVIACFLGGRDEWLRIWQLCRDAKKKRRAGGMLLGPEETKISGDRKGLQFMDSCARCGQPVRLLRITWDVTGPFESIALETSRVKCKCKDKR